MEKLKLSLETLAVETFEAAEEVYVDGTVKGYEAPTGRTRDCPCIVMTTPYLCG